jgi:autoinducer 2-degrading protein
MHVTFVHVHVKLEAIDAFIKATQANHVASVQEGGNCRFDVLQDAQDAGKFVLYEAYVSADAAAAHKQTAHYLTWREQVAPMMAKPRQGVLYNGLLPQV